jgi:hypothetical protein
MNIDWKQRRRFSKPNTLKILKNSNTEYQRLKWKFKKRLLKEEISLWQKPQWRKKKY